jgi:hypothetical protein
MKMVEQTRSLRDRQQVAGENLGATVRHLWRILPWVVVVVMAYLAVALTILPAEALFARIPINYNEGWNAFHALRFRNGGPLYPPRSEAIFINYTPLSFYVIAALHPLVGDDIFAGRLVALLAELVVALNLTLISRTLKVSWPLAVITGLAFLAFVATYYPDYVAMNDPQWLGHALQITGLLVLLRRNHFDWTTLIVVALLFVAGGLVKQNLVALPLAVTIWLIIVDRRTLLRWLTAAIAVAGLALGLCLAAFGQGFIDQVVCSERSYWTIALALVGQNRAIRLAPYVLLATAGTLLQRNDRRVALVGIYLAVSLVTGIAMLAIYGVVYNALFDVTIAMMLGTAQLFERLTVRMVNRPAIPFAASLLFTLPLALLGRDLFAGQANLKLDLNRQPVWQQTIGRIAAAPGPVACETLALCYWAGRSTEIDFFNFGQYAKLHPAFADDVLGKVQDRGIAMIQEDGPKGSWRLPQSVNDAVAAHYDAIQDVPATLLKPAAR